MLDQLEKDPKTAWVKALRNLPDVTWQEIKEEHKKWNYKAQGLTPAASAVIGLAVSLALSWTGAPALLTAQMGLGGLPALVVQAGFKVLVSNASLTLINNKGNIGRTLHDLGSSENIRSIAKAMVQTALLGGGGTPEDFTQLIQVEAVRAVVGGGLDMTF